MIAKVSAWMVGLLAAGTLLAGGANADPDDGSNNVVRKGSFCASASVGETGVSSSGAKLVCQDDGKGKNRWLSAG